MAKSRLRKAIEILIDQADDEGLQQLRREAREHDELCARTAQRVDEIDDQIAQSRESMEQLSGEAEEAREQYHDLSGRLTSLRELQAAALGEYDTDLVQWLKEAGIDDAPRLAAEQAFVPG